MLSSKFIQALDFANQLHADQYRKGTNAPYISHLIRVAGLVLEFGADEETVIAALLHDAVEDQGGMATATKIEKLFGKKVHDIVLECSDSVTEKNVEKASWQQRKEKYIDHLKNSASPEACLVSACDKLDNLQCLWRSVREKGLDSFSIFTGAKTEGLETVRRKRAWYFGEIIKILREKNSPVVPDLEELWNKIFQKDEHNSI